MMVVKLLWNMMRIVCDMRVIDKIGQVIINILIGLIIVIAAFTLYSFVALEILDKDYVSVFGFTYFEVASGSMFPTISKNDMVIVKLNDEYEEEDIVTYMLNGDFITPLPGRGRGWDSHIPCSSVLRQPWWLPAKNWSGSSGRPAKLLGMVSR